MRRGSGVFLFFLGYWVNTWSRLQPGKGSLLGQSLWMLSQEVLLPTLSALVLSHITIYIPHPPTIDKHRYKTPFPRSKGASLHLSPSPHLSPDSSTHSPPNIATASHPQPWIPKPHLSTTAPPPARAEPPRLASNRWVRTADRGRKRRALRTYICRWRASCLGRRDRCCRLLACRCAGCRCWTCSRGRWGALSSRFRFLRVGYLRGRWGL